jgi:hypothetical protein
VRLVNSNYLMFGFGCCAVYSSQDNCLLAKFYLLGPEFGKEGLNGCNLVCSFQDADNSVKLDPVGCGES